MPKNIIIYPHVPVFNSNDGGLVVHYELAKVLKEYNQCVKIYASSGICSINPIFNDYYNNDFPIDNETIVIYCEGIQGNPLNAKYVVRWMLSELGQNVPYEHLNTWNKNELVYYFNSEKKLNDNPEKIGSIYKLLSILHLPPQAIQTNFETRINVCYTIRKAHYIHKNGIKYIHPENAFELIYNNHSLYEYIQVFNKFKYFICYDSLSFYIIISALCGCIPIVYPKDGLSKKDWINTTAVSEYCSIKGLDNLYGIAYGIEDIKYAEDTFHLVKEQWNDIIQFNKDRYIKPFLQDITKFEEMQNTIQNNFY